MRRAYCRRRRRRNLIAHGAGIVDRLLPALAAPVVVVRHVDPVAGLIVVLDDLFAVLVLHARMLVGHRIEYRRIPDRFLDRPVELRRQTELRQHAVVDAVDLRLAVDLVGVILVHDRKSRRTGERIFAPPLVEQPVRIETAALDGQRTQIAVHETPRRPRRIGSRREERRRRIVIDDPQMPAPQDRSRLVDGRHDGIAALVGGLDDDLLLVGGVGYPRNETLRALPNKFGTSAAPIDSVEELPL